MLFCPSRVTVEFSPMLFLNSKLSLEYRIGVVDTCNPACSFDRGEPVLISCCLLIGIDLKLSAALE